LRVKPAMTKKSGFPLEFIRLWRAGMTKLWSLGLEKLFLSRLNVIFGC